ncbi:EndoU domain-containing protein [Hyalangium versicolor]|uniref:EndoU domain-containing protein n=1 Tax=Hyalangium versicolor TaxID=2861190 RepID=UPI001CCD6B2A|nr:EndoU domain-containing protein [Hyalangium versicolor]
MSRLTPLLLTLLLPLTALAGSGAFVSDTRVEAVDQPESKKVVFTVEPDTSYPLLKKGGPGRKWCKLQGSSAEGWVLCDGAEETAVQKAPSATELVKADKPQQLAAVPAVAKQASGCATTCSNPPLFSKPPALSAVDREILALCPARPDVSVSAGDVQRFFSNHYDDERIQKALAAAGRSRTGSSAKQANIEWLTSLWVSTGPRNAFTHVFCGDDWLRGPIGGLHYQARYAQLEAEGKLCYDGPARGKSAVIGDQYLISFHGVAPWSCGEKEIGGFSRTQDAVSIAALGTRAFVRCCARDGAKKEGGIYSSPELGGSSWQIYCGTRNGTYGIATLYPSNESPTCAE